MDLIAQRDRPSHMQQSDVTVQIILPVVLWMDDDLIDRHNLLGFRFKPRVLEIFSLAAFFL